MVDAITQSNQAAMLPSTLQEIQLILVSRMVAYPSLHMCRARVFACISKLINSRHDLLTLMPKKCKDRRPPLPMAVPAVAAMPRDRVKHARKMNEGRQTVQAALATDEASEDDPPTAHTHTHMHQLHDRCLGILQRRSRTAVRWSKLSFGA